MKKNMESFDKRGVHGKSFWLGLALGLMLLVVGLSWGVYGQEDTPPKAQFEGVVEMEAIRFPDGTVLTSAAGSQSPGLSANRGLYDNRIVEIVPPLPYTEVCFKDGAMKFDIHRNSESTVGGNCVPGDVGFVIERGDQGSTLWEDAKAACLMRGMRLPEPFEYRYTCRRASQLGLIKMTGANEWVSNEAWSHSFKDNHGQVVPVIGNFDGPSGCDRGTSGWISRNTRVLGKAGYRCVR